MNAKIITVFLFIGIATLIGISTLMKNQKEKNLNVQLEMMLDMVQEGISPLKREEDQKSDGIADYNSHQGRILTSVTNLADFPQILSLPMGFSSTLSNLAATALGASGFTTALGNTAALGNGLTKTNTNTAALNTPRFGIANAVGNADTTVLGTGNGFVNSITNVGGNVLGGIGVSGGSGAAGILGGSGFLNSNANSLLSNVDGLNVANSLGNAGVTNFAGLGLTNTQSNTAALNYGLATNTLGNAGATILGPGILNSNTISAVANFNGVGISNSQGNSASKVIGYGMGNSNTKSLAEVIGIAVGTVKGNAGATIAGVNGIANSNTDSVAALLGSISSIKGKSGSASITNSAFSTAKSNTAATAQEGLTTGATGSTTFTSPTLSTSISNSNSLAIGKSAASSSGTDVTSVNVGGASANAGSNAGAGVGGSGDLGIAGSVSNGVSATIAGNSFAVSKSEAVGQSFSADNLNGKYQFAFQTVRIIVTKDAFIFKGCSDYSVPIIRENRKVKFGTYESKPNDCEYDPAIKLCKRFYQANKYNRVDDGFAGYDSQGQQFFKASQKQGNKKGQQIYGYFYEGEYDAEQPSYNIKVDNNRLYFEDHEDNPIQFEYKDKGSINFSKHFEKKKDAEVFDKDKSVSDLLISCTKVNPKADNKGYELLDKKGRRLATCSPKKW